MRRRRVAAWPSACQMRYRAHPARDALYPPEKSRPEPEEITVASSGVFLHTIQPAIGCDGQVGGARAAPGPMAVVRRLLSGYPDSMGGDEGPPGRPAAVWPRGHERRDGRRPGAVRRIQRDLIVLAASLAVFAGCAVVASDGRVGPAERAVFHAVNGLPGWLYWPMLAAQYLGVLAVPLVVAAFALVWRRWRLAAALVL